MARRSTRRKVAITQMDDDGRRKIPKNLKPKRTRQIIRRFHTLNKYKLELINSLNDLLHQSLSESTCLTWIESNKALKKIYDTSRETVIQTLKLKNTPMISMGERNTISPDTIVDQLGRIDGEISRRGGIRVYQMASIEGQDRKRGGDTSKKLIQWLKELKIYNSTDHKPNALEIGSLSSKNYISTCDIFSKVDRIDLHSMEPLNIQQQDFLERPIPKDDTEKFNLISCSLVVNFVPIPTARGEMMRRIVKFLNEPNEFKSLLFFVIPLPCISNSRYCNKKVMNTILTNLGFETLKYYESHKLVYWLLKWGGARKVNHAFKSGKCEVNPGSKRNNFCVILD